jgi:hypothetical protein
MNNTDRNDMNKPSKFDLNAAIRQWRDSLGRSPQFRAENLDELEAHLRDSVSTLQGGGLSDEEAFLVATRRLGSAAALAPEFSKVNAREIWLNRLLWMLLGIQLWGLIGSVSGMLSTAGYYLLVGGMTLFGYQIESAPSHTLLGNVAVAPAVSFFSMSVLTLLAVTAGIGWLLRWKSSGVSRAARRRGWLVAGAVAVCLVMLLRTVIAVAGTTVLARMLPQEALGTAMSSMSLASLASSTFITIVLITLTVLLVRRQVHPLAG